MTGVAESIFDRDNTVLYALPWLPLLSSKPQTKIFGLLAVSLIAVWLLLSFGRSKKSDLRAGAILTVILFFVGVSITRSIQSQTFIESGQLILIALALSVAPLLRFTALGIRVCAIFCFCLILVGIADFEIGVNFLFENPNSYGIAAFCWGAILLKTQVSERDRVPVLRVGVCVLISAALIVLSESRASMAALAIAVMWIVTSSVLRSSVLRLFFMLIVLVLPLIVVILVARGELMDVQGVLPLVGEKSPFSGRDVIWIAIIGEISAHNYIGFGLGSLPGGLLEGHYEGLSAHNGFLQLLYQFGAAGLLVFLVACAAVMRALVRRSDRGVSAAIFAGALVHELFEVVLTQNHFGSGLLIWVIVATQMTISPPRSIHITNQSSQ